MTSKNTYIAFSIAILLALLAGFGVARWLDPRSTSQTTPQTETTETADAEGEYEDRHGEESSELKLTAEQVASSKLELSNVTRGGGAAIRLSGRVESMVGARAAVGASTSGRVERVLVAPGTTIRAGSAVATIVSGEGASLRAAADAAAAEADAAQMVYRRDSNLLNQGIVARQEMETSRARALAAAANARASASLPTASSTGLSSGAGVRADMDETGLDFFEVMTGPEVRNGASDHARYRTGRGNGGFSAGRSRCARSPAAGSRWCLRRSR